MVVGPGPITRKFAWGRMSEEDPDRGYRTGQVARQNR